MRARWSSVCLHYQWPYSSDKLLWRHSSGYVQMMASAKKRYLRTQKSRKGPRLAECLSIIGFLSTRRNHAAVPSAQCSPANHGCLLLPWYGTPGSSTGMGTAPRKSANVAMSPSAPLVVEELLDTGTSTPHSQLRAFNFGLPELRSLTRRPLFWINTIPAHRIRVRSTYQALSDKL